MAEMKVRKQEQLPECEQSFEESNHYQKALRFGDNQLKDTLENYIKIIVERNRNAWLEEVYQKASEKMQTANKEDTYKETAALLESIIEYKNASALRDECLEKVENCRKDAIYFSAKKLLEENKIENCEKAIQQFQTILGWKDADEQLLVAGKKLEELRYQEEQKRLEQERKAEQDRIEAKKKAKRNKKIAMIGTPIVCAVIIFVLVLNNVIIPNGKYLDALALMKSGKYEEAITVFELMEGDKDSDAKIEECNYNIALELMVEMEYEKAIIIFESLKEYKESESRIAECNDGIRTRQYNDAVVAISEGKYIEAYDLLKALDGYKDSTQKS